jgi:predicted alpha/beta hydrolase
MASFNYKVGLHNVGSYQVSGQPWASGSINSRIDALDIAQVDFPSVTSWVVVSNMDSANNSLRIGFSSGGVAGLTGPESNNRYLEVPPTSGSGPVRLDLKLTQLFLSGSDNCSLIAGLTGIVPSGINDVKANSPSGSNWSGSAGVG